MHEHTHTNITHEPKWVSVRLSACVCVLGQVRDLGAGGWTTAGQRRADSETRSSLLLCCVAAASKSLARVIIGFGAHQPTTPRIPGILYYISGSGLCTLNAKGKWWLWCVYANICHDVVVAERVERFSYTSCSYKYRELYMCWINMYKMLEENVAKEENMLEEVPDEYCIFCIYAELDQSMWTVFLVR